MKHFITYLLLLFVTVSFAQKDFKTGNTKLDADLKVIDSIANLSHEGFEKYLTSTENISDKKYKEISSSSEITPSEIYFLVEISKMSNTSLDKVYVAYKTSFKEKGWPYIMDEFGMGTSSLSFYEFKSLVSTFKQNQQARLVNEKL